MSELSLGNTDVLILAGGQGKRLRQVVGDRPKPMADISGRPFLDVLIDYASGFGLKRFVIGAGYKAETITAYYEEKGGPQQIVISNELIPLGTGGAIKNAENCIESDPFLVMNGDSFCPVDLLKFYRFHIEKGALLSAALVSCRDARDFGTVEMNDSRQVIRFEEKKDNAQGTFISAGIYFFNRDIFTVIPEQTKCSLEYDIFPKLVGPKFYGFVTDAELIDIGTPERYYKAVKIFSSSRV